ncbi:MAG: diguanylate cyclase [Lachnospiraceae bacterium]|nr:diguanylate cyclase [Lachnospiraceae bacterium]
MRGTSLSRRVLILTLCILIVLVAFSTFIAYVFYSDALLFKYTPDELAYAKKSFFVILITAEAMVALVLAVIAALYIDYLITKPIRSITAVVDILSTENSDNDGLQELNIKSGDEVEELYRSIVKYKEVTDDRIKNAESDNWIEQHDYMTMLDNNELYEKRVREVYPELKHIFVACLKVINTDELKENLGAEAEECMLQKVAREMRRLAGDNVHAYRLSGENFLLVFTEYNEKESRSLIEKWVERVGRLNRASDSFSCRLVWGGAYAENDFRTSDVRNRAMAELERNIKGA